MNPQKGCCDWLFRCFKPNPETQEKVNIPKDDSPQKQKTNTVEQPSPENNQASNNDNIVNNPPDHVNNNTNNVQNQEIELNLPSIHTKFNIDSIDCNVCPDKFKEIRYNCPICFKFYNHILITQCCKNYICLRCINDYIETAKKYCSTLRCPLCNFSGKIRLDDVDPTSKVNRN